jgi:phage replication O-like protein O
MALSNVIPMILEQPLASYNGNPQIEDGYTKIANELLDQIMHFDFTGLQLKIILCVIRKTYGFNKTSDDISLSQISSMCAMNKSHASVNLNKLVEMNVIRKEYGRYGFNLSLNKNYLEWQLVGAKKIKQSRKVDLSKHNHYVYLITNQESQFYIGVRSCLCSPNQDRYLGSGNWISTQDKSKLTKKIISAHESRQDAEIVEAELIQSHKHDINNMNVMLYNKNQGVLHSMKPVTDYVTSYTNDSNEVTQSVTQGLHNLQPQKTTPKDNTKDICFECLNYLNEKANRNYKPVKSNLDFIKARLKEGFTKDEIFHVINVKVSQWLNDVAMNQYLRPATLFNATKFAQYAAEQQASIEKTKKPDWLKV